MATMTYVNGKKKLKSKCLECRKTRPLKELTKYGGICDKCSDKIIE